MKWNGAWMLAGLAEAMLAGAQEPAPVGGLKPEMVNDVWAIVGNKVITSRDVLVGVNPSTAGMWKSLSKGVAKTRDLIEAAKAERDKAQLAKLQVRLVKQLVDLGDVEGRIHTHLQSIIDRHLLVEQVKLDENFREPPGLVDYQLAQQIKGKVQGQQAPKPGDGLAEVLRQQLSRGQTMKGFRRQLLDDWIYRELNREIAQSITISPKQVMDFYRANYARNENEQHDVADIYLIRVPRKAEGFAEQKADLEKVAAGIKTVEEFMAAVKRIGQAGDGPQGLWREGEDNEASPLGAGGKDRRRMGILPDTPRLSLPLTMENRQLVADDLVDLLVALAHVMEAGQAQFLAPPGSPDGFILLVKSKLPKYKVSLELKRLDIEQVLLQNAINEARKRRLMEARRLVHVVNHTSAKK